MQVDLTLNYLLNLFDVQRSGSIRVESFKLGILLLCGGPLTEKYIHLFNLAVDGSGSDAGSPASAGGAAAAAAGTAKIGPAQLARLVFDCIQVPRIFGEVAFFGGTNTSLNSGIFLCSYTQLSFSVSGAQIF